MSEKRVKYAVVCRHFEGELHLPCNWVKDGFCGVDAKKCDITILGAKSKGEG